MSMKRSQLDDVYVWVKMLDEREDYSFGKLFRIVRAKLQYRRFDGMMSAPITRISFDAETRSVCCCMILLMTRCSWCVSSDTRSTQGLSLEARAGDGVQQAWLLEIVAGVQDADLTVGEVANKELLEESGYRIRGDLQRIATIYSSPGASSNASTSCWEKWT